MAASTLALTSSRTARQSDVNTCRPMKATMPRSSSHDDGWAGRTVRSMRLVTAAARGAAFATGDASGSVQAGARHASGHLEFVSANNSAVTSTDASSTEFLAAMTAMIDAHTAMYAAVARTAPDEGFEEIADWFETLAKAGRSRALLMAAKIDRLARQSGGQDNRPQNKRLAEAPVTCETQPSNDVRGSTLAHHRKVETRPWLTKTTSH